MTIEQKQKRSRLKALWTRIALFLAIMGPGIITGNVDNDAGGITTYSIVGARYQYTMLWGLLLTTVALIVIQEMVTRMGIVTGKGLADLIRERFGVRITFFAMAILLFANLATTVSDFAGIAAGAELFGLSRYLVVPLLGLIIWWVIIRGSNHQVERILLLLSAVFLTYVVSGIMAKPDWGAVWHNVFVPTTRLPNGKFAFTDTGYLTIFIAMVGTTITPWMQFYQQAMVVDKGLSLKDLKYARIDTFVGSLMTDFFSLFMIVACGAVLFPKGVLINDAVEAAAALGPLAGKYAAGLFAFGLLNASAMAATVLPLSTAYAVSEAFGWESAVGRRWSEAPEFFTLFTVMIVIGVVAVLNPGLNLIKIMLFSQTLNGILLPLILIVMLILVNDKSLMGEHTNSRLMNVIAWGMAIFLIAMTVALLGFTVAQSAGWMPV